MTDGLHAFLAEQKQDELTTEERRSLVWLALKASLAVGGVFVLAAFLFLLFCVMYGLNKRKAAAWRSLQISGLIHVRLDRKHGSAIVRSMITASRSAGSDIS